MIIKIDKKYTGKKDINIVLNDNIEKSKLIYSTNDDNYSLNDIMKIENITPLNKLENIYYNLYKSLNIDKEEASHLLSSMIGSHNTNKNLIDIKIKINELKSRNLNYYNEFYYQRCQLTEMIEVSVYSHSSTITGRSTIKKGINYLTMKKEDRKNIKSQFKGGKIIEMDIVSLEPRILCKFNEFEFIEDVYTHVSDLLNVNNIYRKKIKLGLLAIIYGASYNTVKKLSGLNSKECQKIKEYFKIDELKNILKKEIAKKSKIENMYGRPIFNSSALINHFIQSSAADCAQLAFMQYLKNKNRQKFKLIAVIHDAIIIDCHPSMISKFIDTYMISEEYLNINLPVKAKVIA